VQNGESPENGIKIPSRALLILLVHLLHVGGPDGEVKAEVENQAVRKENLKWQGEGSTMKDIIVRLRHTPVSRACLVWTFRHTPKNFFQGQNFHSNTHSNGYPQECN
jgi:hypothetical protein